MQNAECRIQNEEVSVEKKECVMSGIQRRVLEWIERISVWPMMVYRKWKYGYTFRQIYLGEGEYTIVDPDIYYKYRHIKWFSWATRKIITQCAASKMNREIQQPNVYTD